MGKMIQNNFGAGEISPVLYGRSDLQAYYKGCAIAENFVVTKEGTLRKRRGIKTFARLEFPGMKAFKLGAYNYDRTTSFLLVFVPSATGQIECLAYGKDGRKHCHTLTGATAGSEAEVEAIQTKQIGDQIWVTNGKFFKILKYTLWAGTGNLTCTAADWSQEPKPAAVNSFRCVGYNYEGTANTTGVDVNYCAYVVKNGVMSPLKRARATQKREWVAGSYTRCTITVTAAQLDTMDYVALGKSLGGTTAYGELARFFKEDFTQLEATYEDKNVMPGDSIYAQTNVLGDGFSAPLCADCYQQRRVLANATSGGMKLPMTMWFSEAGNLTNFYANRPSADSDAFSPTIASTGPAFIRWICAFQENLILFTDCGLFSVGFSQTSGFSANSCRISRFSQLKVSPDVQPVATDAGIVFVGADNKTLYTASYSLQENALKPINRTVLVEHLTRTAKIAAIGLQEYPDNVIWVALEDGTMAAFVYEANEEVYGWARSRLAVEGARVKSLVSLGSVTEGEGKRTYGDVAFAVEYGGIVRLAYFQDVYKDEIGELGEDYSGAGWVRARLVTLRPESQQRTLAGQKKNVKDMTVRLYETGEISVRSPSGGDMPLVNENLWAKGSGLFSGDVKVMPRGCVNEEGQLELVSEGEDPCEVLQIVTSLEVE